MERIKAWVEGALKGGYDYEVYLEQRKKTLIETSDESLENLLRAEDFGVGIRVFKDNKMGFAYTTDLREESVKETVKVAKEICHITPPDEGFTLGGCQNWGNMESYYDQEGLKKPVEEKIELLISLERKAKKLDSRVKGVRKTSLREIESHILCLNSCGLFYEYKGTWYASMMALLAEEDHDQSISYEYIGSRSLSSMPFDSMVEDVVFKATSLLKPSSFETKKIPVILYRDTSAMLLEAFSPIFLGDSLVKGKTLLKDKKGQKVFSEKLTLLDDGTIQDGFMSLPLDAEGYPTQRNVLVKDGVFKGFLHSSYSAIKSKEEPTGNSIRESFKSLPSSGITNLYIQPGEVSLEEMLKDQSEVLLITELMGLHTVDPVSGDFSLGASGLIYKKGKKHMSVRGVVIGGNIRDLWGSIIEVGKDLKFYGNVGSPSLYIKELTVGG